MKNFHCSDCGSTPGFDREFFKYFLHVLFHGGLGDAENRGDVRVRLALGEPEQRLRGARRKTEGEQWF